MGISQLNERPVVRLARVPLWRNGHVIPSPWAHCGGEVWYGHGENVSLFRNLTNAAAILNKWWYADVRLQNYFPFSLKMNDLCFQ